jgi:hypothetical protein
MAIETACETNVVAVRIVNSGFAHENHFWG